MDISFITSIADKVKDAFSKGSEEQRRHITDALREIQFSVEPPEETMQRLIYQVRLALAPGCERDHLAQLAFRV